MALDRSKLNATEIAVLDKVMSFGISETDAEVIADSIINKKSCSWVNTDDVNEATIKSLNEFITANNCPIVVIVEPIATRGKYVWEIKLKR